MGQYSEVFVAFDVANKKHAVAIAEGGRAGRSGFWAMSDWLTDTTACMSASKPGRLDTDFIARSRLSAMIA